VSNLVKPIASFYIPDKSDIIHCQFQPEINLVFQRGGHSLKDPHYAIVLSPYTFNKLTKLAMVCPITSTVRGYIYELPVPEVLGLTGVLRVDQFTTIDYVYQKATHYNNLKAPDELVEDIKSALSLILGLSKTS